MADCPDRRGELMERSGQAVFAWNATTEFVVTSSNILDQSMTRANHSGGRVRLQAPHRSRPGLESPMVSLAAIVGILLCVVERLRRQLVDRRRVESSVVVVTSTGRAAHRSARWNKPLCRWDIPSVGKHGTLDDPAGVDGDELVAGRVLHDVDPQSQAGLSFGQSLVGGVARHDPQEGCS